MRAIRGNRIAMIFQDPMMALDSSTRSAARLRNSLKLHKGLSEAAGA